MEQTATTIQIVEKLIRARKKSDPKSAIARRVLVNLLAGIISKEISERRVVIPKNIPRLFHAPIGVVVRSVNIPNERTFTPMINRTEINTTRRIAPMINAMYELIMRFFDRKSIDTRNKKMKESSIKPTVLISNV